MNTSVLELETEVKPNNLSPKNLVEAKVCALMDGPQNEPKLPGKVTFGGK